MNTRTPHDSDRSEREWQAQERAREAEKRGLPLEAGQRAVAEYRLIARALRTPAMEPLPADLAAQIVAHVNAAQAMGERVERWMLRILGLVLAVAAAGAVAMYGASWAPAFAELLPRLSGNAIGWVALVAGCLAVSSLGQGIGRWLGTGLPV
jgi:uncharacterized membrane protein YecN with MAPEG domain